MRRKLNIYNETVRKIIRLRLEGGKRTDILEFPTVGNFALMV